MRHGARRAVAPAAVAAAALLAAGALSACRQQPIIERVPDRSTSAPAPTPTPTPSPTPHALRSQRPGPGCVAGWREPAATSALGKVPLDLLNRSQRVTGPYDVVDLRYFTAPDRVERWYVRAVRVADRSFALRFLAERRPGKPARIAAVANYITEDFTSPDWYGFADEGGSYQVTGVPGRWPGVPFDYVQARKLPAPVTGCLAGAPGSGPA